MTVLVLDGHTDAALAVLQSLGRSGYACWIADCVRRPYAALRSRYASQTAEYPDPLQDRPQFQEWVVQFQQAHRFDLIIPVTEATLIPLDEHRAEPALSGVVAIPPATAVEVAFDKEKSRQLAASLGIPTPRTVLLSTNAARGQLDEWLRAFPVVVKATRSRVWRGGRGFRMEVALARTRSELDHVLDRVSPLTPVQVQDWMPGSGLGVEVLVRSGEVLWSFAHRRIHENPVWGGASTYREAIVPPPDLLEATATLMRRLAWHGVAMVEFRVNPATGERWFLEINGRFWGSLPLAIHAGADFPRALVELLLENRDPPSPAARTGVYARNLAKDVRWTKNYLRQRRTPDPHLLRRPALGTLLEWSRVLTGREIWDGASVRDPGPIVHEVASTAWNELRTFARGARRAWVRRRARASSIARLRNLQATRRLLALCYGNICRSPYVEARLRAIGQPVGLELRSRGFHAETGRQTPAVFQQACLARGVDLSAHRSRRVEAADLAWADMILLMDHANSEALRILDRRSLRKALWLGALHPTGDVEIADPYGRARDGIEPVLDSIDVCVAVLARRLAPSPETRNGPSRI